MGAGVVREEATSERLSTPMALFDSCSEVDSRGGTGTSTGNPPRLPSPSPRPASPESPPLPAGGRHFPSLHCSAPPGNDDPGTAVRDGCSGVEAAFSCSAQHQQASNGRRGGAETEDPAGNAPALAAQRRFSVHIEATSQHTGMGVLSFMMGVPTIKAIAGRDFYEVGCPAFNHGQSATHTVIRRTINSLADGPALQVKGATDEEKDGWMQYVTLTLEFLQVHHNQEDRFVFPQARRVSNNHNLLTGEENEHKIVDDIIKWWHAVCQTVGEGAARLTQAVVVEATKKFAALQKVMCARGGHLEREERLLTADFWRESAMTELELRDLNTDMHRIIGPALAFFVMNLSDEEKKFFDERVPYPVRKWVFPTYCEEIKKALPFCAFPRYEVPASPDGHNKFGWLMHVRPSWFATHAPKSSSSLHRVMAPSMMPHGATTMPQPMQTMPGYHAQMPGYMPPPMMQSVQMPTTFKPMYGY
ncbi:hypothetical protein T484DRAFT_1773273 [Baffinella frigidus]|nr:hypothetical protein T484DRAFT_1773273 [Cryptophyta sp. CCMP2293]